MILLRVIVTLIACWIVKCDLLDLYVQHMDETMRTMPYRNKRHPMDPVSRRIKRNLQEDEPLLRIGNFKKQRLNVDENWLKEWKAKGKIVFYKNDGLNYPNKYEKNLDSDQHEMLLNTTQDSKYPEKKSTIIEDAAENSQLNILQNPLIKQQEKTLADELVTIQNETNVEKLAAEDVEREEELSAENWRAYEEIETENNSQFEIISKNERINPKSFVASSFKGTPKLHESRVPKKYFPEKSAKNGRDAKSSFVKDEMRSRRSVKEGVNEDTSNVKPKFTRYEKLNENGDVILEWDPSDDEEVIFRVTAKTLGYVGIGFNEKSHMKGADILLAWVDDHTSAVNLLGDTVRVLWALHETDPELNTAVWHGDKRGGKALRLKTAAAHSPPRETHNMHHWDVKLNLFEVNNDTDTIYWCKIFKPTLKTKHHMIGYVPLVEKANEDLVHHIILYECASTDSILGEHARMSGARCYSPTTPRAWDSCMQPILAWARGSKGEWMPEHVGIPIAERKENSYYMLEVHYNNPSMKKVLDSSGIRLYFTPTLRSKDAGILVAGVAVSPLHLIPPRQKEYATAGYCTPHCTNTMLPENGINIVSVVLHSHLAGRRLSLKHIRQGKELPRIVQDNHFDFDYQQSHTLEKEVNVLPGDELVAECVYGTLDRTRPTLGGYAASQEMCLAFVVHYPRTPLAACYSMTPVKDLFETLGVSSFRGVTMNYLEKLFLTNETDLSSDEISKTVVKKAESALRAMRDYTKGNEDNNIFAQLVIEEPEEFRGRTMAEHMLAMPWTEELLASKIENSLYHGRHMTFCRKRDDQLALPADIQNFPNYTALPETNDTTCSELNFTSGTSGVPYIPVINLVIIIVVSIML
ncbi:hypothetical protein P5V15_006950 [Pogonomyrmex californicus]